MLLDQYKTFANLNDALKWPRTDGRLSRIRNQNVRKDREGKSFEGEGDAAFAASEGKKVGASIDPVKAKAAEAAPAASVATAGTASAAAGAAPTGSGFVQLGAFSDTAKAGQAWTAMGQRFGFLSGLNRRVVEGAAEGGRKVFRLQAVTANPAAAQQLCAKLKAAGENCMVVK
jgi:cell division septation protein DedD